MGGNFWLGGWAPKKLRFHDALYDDWWHFLAGRLGGWLGGCLQSWLGGLGEDKLRKLSHLKSDDSMMLVIMIGWQFLAGRLAG